MSVQKYGLNVVINAYSGFQNPLLTKLENNKSFRNLESRFVAAVAKIKSHSGNALHQSLTALMLLHNSNIDANQPISVLSSATSHNTESTSTLINEQLMYSVTNDLIASVLHQCDFQKSCSSDTLRANSTSFLMLKWNRYHPTPQKIAELKKISRSKRY